VHTSTYVIRVIKSKRMRWVGYTARVGDEKYIAYKILVVYPKGERLRRSR